MKTLKFLPAVALLAFVLVSCGSSRDYHRSHYPPPPPPPRAAVSLILSPRPGLVISVHPNGRQYYRDPYGRIYWRGPDHRFYLDRKYMRRSYHSHRQYRDWRRYYR